MVGWLRMFSIQGFLTWQSKLPMTYKHLSQAERYQIHALMKAGHDQTQIAKLLDRHNEALLKLFYLALNNIAKKWTMPVQNWKPVLNRFTIQFGERMPAN